jgi:biopolymer transport protein ExbD
MALGGNSFDKDDFSAPMAEINTTPLVDVMLVLLVIFLVTAPMLTQAVKLELPNEKAQAVDDKNPVIISVDANGNYFWNSSPVSKDALNQKMLEQSSYSKNQALHLKADKQASYEKVSHILAVAQRNGLNNIGFITQPE